MSFSGCFPCSNAEALLMKAFLEVCLASLPVQLSLLNLVYFPRTLVQNIMILVFASKSSRKRSKIDYN